jgi:hypothetical protein
MWSKQDRMLTLVSSVYTRSTSFCSSLSQWDAQLSRLGNVLVTPTRQVWKRFAPSNGLSHPDNVLAPLKTPSAEQEGTLKYLHLPPYADGPKGILPPSLPVALRPCQNLLPNILCIYPTFTMLRPSASHPPPPPQGINDTAHTFNACPPRWQEVISYAQLLPTSLVSSSPFKRAT